MSEEDTEGKVLKRFDRLKAWWEYGSTAVKAIKLAILGVKLLFVGSATAVVVGEVTDTKPIRTAAVETGFLQPDTNRAELLTRIDSLDETVEQLNAALDRLKTHNHNYPDPIDGQRGPAGKSGKEFYEHVLSDILIKHITWYLRIGHARCCGGCTDKRLPRLCLMLLPVQRLQHRRGRRLQQPITPVLQPGIIRRQQRIDIAEGRCRCGHIRGSCQKIRHSRRHAIHTKVQILASCKGILWVPGMTASSKACRMTVTWAWA